MVASQAPTLGLPYRPGWLDRLFDWVDRRPLPRWAFYLLLALLAYTIETGVKWSDGSYKVGQFNLFHLVFSGSFVLALALIHHLRVAAQRAFERFKPFLNSSSQGQLEGYLLTTAPLARSLISSGLGVAWSLIQYALAPAEPASKLYTSPQATVVDMVFLLLFWAVFGAGIHWLLHYLRATSLLYRKSSTDLLRPQPLYLFFVLNLRLTLVATVLNYGWLALAPQRSLQLNDYLASGLIELVMVASFVLPAWSVHRMLLSEKRRLHDEVHARTERLVTQLYVEIDLGSYGQMDNINKGLMALQAEHALLDRASTWPWPIETPRVLVTVILVPILLWITQRLLERFGM